MAVQRGAQQRSGFSIKPKLYHDESDAHLQPSGRYRRVKAILTLQNQSHPDDLGAPPRPSSALDFISDDDIMLFGEDDPVAVPRETVLEPPLFELVDTPNGLAETEENPQQEESIDLGFEDLDEPSDDLSEQKFKIENDQEKDMVEKIRLSWDASVGQIQADMLSDRKFQETMRKYLWDLYAGDVPINSISDMLYAFMISRKHFDSVKAHINERRYMSYFFRQLAPRLVKVKDGYNNNFMHYLLYLDRGGARNFIYCAEGLGEWCRRHERGGMDRSGHLRRATTDFLIRKPNIAQRTAMDLAQKILTQEEQDRLRTTLSHMISAMAC